MEANTVEHKSLCNFHKIFKSLVHRSSIAKAAKAVDRIIQNCTTIVRATKIIALNLTGFHQWEGLLHPQSSH